MRPRADSYSFLLLACCLAPLLGGCSSASQAVQPGTSSSSGRGSVHINIHWPSVPKSRLIPLASESIEVDLIDPTSRDGDILYSAVASRPTTGSTSTITILNVRPGNYTEMATAFPESDASGVPQAVGSQSIVVVVGIVNNTADLVMNTTITSVVISPANPTTTVGGAPVTLIASALSGTAVVLTAPSNFLWTLKPTTTATLNPNGASASLNPLALGAASVSVRETESGVSSSVVSVSITSGTTTTPPPTGLPILIADIGNNRIVGLDAIPPTTTATYDDSASGAKFSSPVGVSQDTSGRIYVGLPSPGEIVRIDDFTGKNRVTYKPAGMALNYVYVDKAGKIYWIDDNGAVNRIDDITGTNHLTYGASLLGGSPTSIAVDSSNRIYVWDGSNVIYRFDDMTGKNLTHYGTLGAGKGHFNARRQRRRSQSILPTRSTWRIH